MAQNYLLGAGQASVCELYATLLGKKKKRKEKKL